MFCDILITERCKHLYAPVDYTVVVGALVTFRKSESFRIGVGVQLFYHDFRFLYILAEETAARVSRYICSVFK